MRFPGTIRPPHALEVSTRISPAGTASEIATVAAAKVIALANSRPVTVMIVFIANFRFFN